MWVPFNESCARVVRLNVVMHTCQVPGTIGVYIPPENRGKPFKRIAWSVNATISHELLLLKFREFKLRNFQCFRAYEHQHILKCENLRICMLKDSKLQWMKLINLTERNIGFLNIKELAKRCYREFSTGRISFRNPTKKIRVSSAPLCSSRT